jgi:hypothetical protein
VWALGLLLLRSIIGEAIDADLLVKVRRQVDRVVPLLFLRVQESGAICRFADLLGGADRAQPVFRAWFELGAPPDDDDREILSGMAYRVIGSECGVFVVREASEEGLAIEHIVTGASYDIDEPASYRSTDVGDYVFGRVLRRVPPEVLAKHPEADRSARRSDLAEGAIVVTVADRGKQRLMRRYVETADPAFDQAFVVEGALRIAGGEQPYPRKMLPAESPEEARALYAEIVREMKRRPVGTEPTADELAALCDDCEESPEASVTRDPDAAMVEWMAALQAQGRVRTRS